MRFQCPFCRGIVAVENSDIGTEVQCGHCGEVVTVPLSRVSTNAVINDFIILEELGRGGMGVVYLVYQISLDRDAALKVLADSFANNAEYVVGFIKEARAAAKLNHPHIVQAYAVGQDEGVFYFAMEHVDGETLKSVLKRETVIPVDQALMIIQQIAEALDYAWKEQRLIHRDIKPDNIMITKNGRAKLADLGLARVASEIDDTGDDEVMGTPQYISPEHLTGAPMDIRSDIYSLGATFYHLITGRFPFEGRTATEIARKHLEEPLSSPKEINAKIPESVCQIIQKMMAKKVKNRYQDAEELVEDLRMVRRGKNPMNTGKFSSTGSSGVARKSLHLNTKTGKTGKTGAFRTRKLEVSATDSSKKIASDFTPGTQTAADLRKMHSSQAKKKLIILVIVVLLLCAVGGGFIFRKNIMEVFDSGSGSNETPKPSSTTHKTNENAVKSKYIEQVEELTKFINKNPNKENVIISKFDTFYSSKQKPETEDEKIALRNLMNSFAAIDETHRLADSRNAFRKKHLEELQANKENIEQNLKKEAEQKRIEEEKKASQARKEKIEGQRKKREQDRIEREKKALKNYKKRIDEIKNQIRGKFISFCKDKEFDKAIKEFSTAAKEKSLTKNDPVKSPEAEKAADWAKKMVNAVKLAQKVWETMIDGGRELAGVKIEYKGHYAPVSKINDGIVTLKLGGSKTVTAPLKRLAKKDFKKLAKKAAQAIGNENAYFYFLMCNGDFKAAFDNLSDDREWKKELKSISKQNR